MIVTAKRLGWDEQLTPVQELDHDPYDYEDDDLEGELVQYEAHGIKVCLVGGQEADPGTVQEVASTDEGGRNAEDGSRGGPADS